MGSYSKTYDDYHRNIDLQWPFYGAQPDDNDHERLKQYHSSVSGQFGETLFEEVCLEVRPQILAISRDNWMDHFVLESPFRKYFKIIWMPMVDSEPQKQEWLDDYRNVDLFIPACRYAKEVINREAPDINCFDIARPAVNHNIFKPLDKVKIREKHGIHKDWNVILTVMRNQKRKLFPDLVQAFQDYIKYLLNKNEYDLANKTYLYLHTSYPDVGFDIGKLVLNSGLGHRILSTYVCKACGNMSISFFDTELATCPSCHQNTAHMPNTNFGVTEEQLCEVYNLADLYVQFSVCEGLNMPVAEAKSCEVSAMGPEYAATKEQVEVEGCWPIKIKHFFHEAVIETEQVRGYPDTKDLVKKMYHFFSLSKAERLRLGKLCREDAVKNYTFERAAKVFMDAIDSLEVQDENETWLNPKPRLINPGTNPPANLSNGDFIDWCIQNVLFKHELLNSFWRNQLIKDLNVGYTAGRRGRESINQQKLYQMLFDKARSINAWEIYRINKLSKNREKEFSFEMV